MSGIISSRSLLLPHLDKVQIQLQNHGRASYLILAVLTSFALA